MKLADVETILRALNDAEVRYLIVGGLAVVAHGYVRYTADVDIVLDLKSKNASRAMKALGAIGYRPLLPVDAVDFADAELRKTWHEEKGMLVFQMLDENRPDTRLDLFVTEPFDFDREFAAAKWEEVASVKAPVLQVATLIAMKKQVGRTRDLLDIEELSKLVQSRKK
jgi:predicted nucleotidyltransferase